MPGFIIIWSVTYVIIVRQAVGDSAPKIHFSIFFPWPLLVPVVTDQAPRKKGSRIQSSMQLVYWWVIWIKNGKEKKVVRERSWTSMHCSRDLSQPYRDLESWTGPLEKSQIESKSQTFILLHRLVIKYRSVSEEGAEAWASCQAEWIFRKQCFWQQGECTWNRPWAMHHSIHYRPKYVNQSLND